MSEARSSLDLHGRFDVETPEQVAFRMERAGLGTRIVATIVDTACLAFLYFALALTFGGVFGMFPDSSGEAALVFIGILIVVMTFLFWGYYIAFEIAWNGQTPGKRLVGIRVVGDTGVPVTSGMVVIRNLLRFVDVQFGYAIGVVSIFATKDEKRLGDLAAGTIVIRERRRAASSPLQTADPTARGRALDPRLLELLRDYYARSEDLDPQTRQTIAGNLANRLAQGLGREPVAADRAEEELRRIAKVVLEVARESPQKQQRLPARSREQGGRS